VQQVMLQSLPVDRPDQLWRIGDQPHCCHWAGYSQDSDDNSGDWNLFPWEAYKLFRANTTGFQNLAAFQAGNFGLAVRHAGSSGHLIARWKASRMTRGECRATLFSLPSAVRKVMAINSSIKRSSREPV